MVEDAKRQPLISSLSSIITSIIGVGLLVTAVIQWRQANWGELFWLAAFMVSFLIRVPYGVKVRKNVIDDRRDDGRDRVLLFAMFLAMMVLPLVHLSFGVFSFADYRLPAWATVIGALLQVGYLWLFWRSHADLDRNWSPGLELRGDHELVTRGVYARMRHPMYAAIWLGAIGQALLLHNWIAGFLVVPAFAAMYFLRVPKEEAMMRARFGAAYDDYASNVGRIWPGKP